MHHHLCRLWSEEREQYRFWTSLAKDGVVGLLYFYEIVACWRLPVARALELGGRKRHTCLRVGAGHPDIFFEGALEHDENYGLPEEIPPWLDVGDEEFSTTCFRMPLPYCRFGCGWRRSGKAWLLQM